MCAFFFIRIQGADYYYPGFSLATMISRSNIPNYFLPGTHLIHLGRVRGLPKHISAVAGVQTSHLVINNPGTYPPYHVRTNDRAFLKGARPWNYNFVAGKLILQMFDAGLNFFLSIQDIVMPLHPNRYYIKDPLSRETKHTISKIW